MLPPEAAGAAGGAADLLLRGRAPEEGGELVQAGRGVLPQLLVGEDEQRPGEPQPVQVQPPPHLQLVPQEAGELRQRLGIQE